MVTLPFGTRIVFSGFGEKPTPDVQRDEMERGPANQELLNSRVRVEVSATLLFESRDAITAFFNWYYNTIKVIGYFDMIHPRTGQLIQARFIGGDIGTVSPLAPGFYAGSTTTTIEYYAS